VLWAATRAILRRWRGSKGTNALACRVWVARKQIKRVGWRHRLAFCRSDRQRLYAVLSVRRSAKWCEDNSC
jgi:hypothetical protein